MDYRKLHEFILFVLLQEGKSNIKYLIYHFIFGENLAVSRYFKNIFQGCDNATFLYYCDLFKKEYNKDLSIKVELDSNDLLTGKILGL